MNGRFEENVTLFWCVSVLWLSFVVAASVKDEIFGRGAGGDRTSLRDFSSVNIRLQNLCPTILVYVFRQGYVQ
jgi:hypothetical protein